MTDEELIAEICSQLSSIAHEYIDEALVQLVQEGNGELAVEFMSNTGNFGVSQELLMTFGMFFADRSRDWSLNTKELNGQTIFAGLWCHGFQVGMHFRDRKKV